ncbi:MAG: ROK family transcriptional regulator [Caulobacterales bacterium]
MSISEEKTFGASALPLTPSERQMLAALFKAGPLTQAALADRLGLAQQSASRILTQLQHNGLVLVGAKSAPGRRGYPSAAAELNPEHAHAAGVAIMADAVAVVLCDFTGTVIGEATEILPTMAVAGVLDWIETNLARLRKASATVPLAGIGVAMAGSFLGDRTGFNTPYYLNDWAGLDVEAVFEDRFKIPAFAENDGNAAALGESILGVGRWAPSFAYLYVSAGVGGGVVLDGELWRGRFGNAGEFAGGLPSNIYPFPSLEMLRHIAAKHGRAYESVSHLVAHFDRDLPGVDDWVARVRDSLSLIASNATAILDLDAIVLGGLLPRSLAERIIPAIETYDQRRRAHSRPVAKIVPAETPGNAAAIGAAVLPLRNAYFAMPRRMTA